MCIKFGYFLCLLIFPTFKILQNTISATADKEDDEASRAVKSIILDKNESEILERITRTTQEVKSNKSSIDPNRMNSSQVGRNNN